MAWCPKCKNEYRAGITVCADCGCELVEESALSYSEPILVGPQEYMQEVKNYLEFNGLEGVELKYIQQQDVFAVIIHEKDREQAVKLVQVYIHQQNEQAREAAEEDAKEQETVAQTGSDNGMSSAQAEQAAMAKAMAAKEEARKFINYRNSADRAEDNKSSAWSLLLVGGIGVVFLLLCVFNVLPFHFNPFFYGVMIVFLGLFIVMGFVSLKSAKGYSQIAKSEKALKNEIKTWCKENVTAEMLDSRLKIHGMAEQEKYFHRSALLRMVINGKFHDLDQAFLEHYIDEDLYDMIYSEEEV